MECLRKFTRIPELEMDKLRIQPHKVWSRHWHFSPLCFSTEKRTVFLRTYYVPGMVLMWY